MLLYLSISTRDKVFTSRNYRGLIRVSLGNLMFLKLAQLFALEASLLGQIFILRISNFLVVSIS